MREEPTRPLDLKELREEERIRRKARESLRPVLLVMSGSRIGTSIRLHGSLLVGQDPKSDLVLLDEGVAWHHARIEDRGDGWVVVDLTGGAATRVNDRRVTECVLAPNDLVSFGGTHARFEVHGVVEQEFHERLRRLLDQDDLSGLYVRRIFDSELRILMSAATHDGKKVGLLSMDLDGVKRINDAHGHHFGAHLIGEAGRIIGDVIGRRGFAARFGGDEFIAALRDASVRRSMQLAKEINRSIAEHTFHCEDIALTIGISIGVASFPESARDVEGLLRAADAALYRAKRAGGNRVAS